MLQFLTTIPIPVSLNIDEEDFGKGLAFAPLVGLVIGGILAAAAVLSGYVFPLPVTAVLIFIFYIILTGGIHLDGLGDTFDGLFSNRSRERMLEIMRDSRVGTNAVLAIVSVMLVNVAAYWAIGNSIGSGFMEYSYGPVGFNSVIAVLLMPVAGRIGSVVGAGISKYARQGEGLGKPFIDVCGIKEMSMGLAIALVIFILAVIAGLFPIQGLLLYVVAIVSAVILTKIFSARIGGMTGDTLGAVCELNQAIFLLCYYICLK